MDGETTAVDHQMALIEAAEIADRLGTMSWTSDGSELIFSSGIARNLGIPAWQPIPFARVLRAVHPDDAQDFQRLLRSRKPRTRRCTRFVDDQGSHHHLCFDNVHQNPDQQQALVYRCDHPGPAEGIATGREEVLHANRVVIAGELLGSLVHDLGQPLAAILTNAQAGLRLLELGAPDTEFEGILSDIISNDRAAFQVIKSVRSLVSKHRSSVSDVDVNECLRQAVDLMASEILIRGVAAEVQLDPQRPTVRFDAVQLKQVIVNLLCNALDAVSERPRGERRVTLTSLFDPAIGVIVEVTDSGRGIGEGRLERIFEPFYSGRPGKLGMGLAVCARIMAFHGGSITAGSSSTGGARLTVTIPNHG